MAEEVTEEDRNMVVYFIQEKGDVTRWVQWEKRKGVIGKEYPELIAALDAQIVADRTLKAVVHSIQYP